MKRAFLLIGLTLSVTTTSAQTATQAWVQRYHGPGNGNDSFSSIAVDSDGDLIFTGPSTGDGTGYDVATIKYSNNGVPLWTNRYNGGWNQDDVPYGLALDTNSNVFVTGRSEVTNSHLSVYSTIAYSSAGAPMWTNYYSLPGVTPGFVNHGEAIAVGGNGDVFVTGTDSYSSEQGIATVAYSSLGVSLWTNRALTGWLSGGYARSVAVNSGGDVFVAAMSGILPSYVNLLKYSGAGALLSSNRWIVWDKNNSGFSSQIRMVFDGDGNVFLISNALFSGGTYDYLTVSCSSDCVQLWTNRYDGPANGDDYFGDIAADSAGDVVVAGNSWNGSTYDLTTIKYSKAGEALWTNRFYTGNLTGFRRARVAVDFDRNVIVSGTSTNSESGCDITTIAYSTAGVPLWTNLYNGPKNGDDIAEGVKVDPNGNAFVAGYSWNGTNNEFAVIKYAVTPGGQPPIIEIRTANNQAVLSWSNASFRLQSSPYTAAAFTNVPDATSPYTNTVSGPAQFFRLISD